MTILIIINILVAVTVGIHMDSIPLFWVALISGAILDFYIIRS